MAQIGAGGLSPLTPHFNHWGKTERPKAESGGGVLVEGQQPLPNRGSEGAL